jgi:hypothetical protein
MSKYHRDDAAASDPGGVSLSLKKYRGLVPELSGALSWLWRLLGSEEQFIGRIQEHLQMGDSRAACVVSLDPLLVAAYTDELDCVAVLSFPDRLIEEHDLKLGKKLLAVNTYFDGPKPARDLTPGPNDQGNWANFSR